MTHNSDEINANIQRARTTINRRATRTKSAQSGLADFNRLRTAKRSMGVHVRADKRQSQITWATKRQP